MNFLIRFGNLPFIPIERQIIYVENDYDEEVNNYLQGNYTTIVEYFKNKGYTFIYFPAIAKALSHIEADMIQGLPEGNTSFVPIKSDYLLRWMINQDNRNKIKPSLLYYNSYGKVSDYEEAVYQFRAVTLTPDTNYNNTNNLSNILEHICESTSYYKNRIPKFHRLPTQVDVTKVLGELPKEKKQTLELLCKELGEDYLPGIGIEILGYMICGQKKLSRLLITKDYRILLIDEGNVEIEMTYLPKAVYLLYLRHPEGIAFNCLADHRKELTDLYKAVYENSVKKRNFTVNREMALENLFLHKNNIVNDVRNKIRSPFIEYFKSRSDEHLANNYILNGDSGEKMQVCLESGMVIWEENLEKYVTPYQESAFTLL